MLQRRSEPVRCLHASPNQASSDLAAVEAASATRSWQRGIRPQILYEWYLVVRWPEVRNRIWSVRPVLDGVRLRLRACMRP